MAICRCTVGEVAIERVLRCPRRRQRIDFAELSRPKARACSAPTVGARTVCAAIIVGHHFDTFGAAARHDRRARCPSAQSCGN